MSTETRTLDTAGQTLSRRRYRFAEHGVRPAEQRYLAWRWSRQHPMAGAYAFAESPPPQQRTSRRGRQPYTVATPDQFRLARLADPKLLHTVYQILKAEGGPGPGIDGLTYDDFSPAEIHAALRAVSAALRSRAYLPYPTRPVLVPKDFGRWRELQLQRITDRTVAKALQVCLDSYWRSHLPGIGRGVWRIYAEIERAIRERRAYVLAIDDIRDCFPSTPVNAVMGAHRLHIHQPDLLCLVETIIRGHDGPDHAVGLDQGSPHSPAALELTLHTRLDARLEAEQRGSPLLWRYVDNLTYVCSSEREGHQALQVTGDILAEMGMALKGQDGPPRDIRDRDYNRVLLGLIPRWQDGRMALRIPEDAYGDLELALSEAQTSPRPPQTARAVVDGWLGSAGPALTRSATPAVVDRVVSTLRRWGITEISVRDLDQTARRAQQRWLGVLEGQGVSGRG